MTYTHKLNFFVDIALSLEPTFFIPLYFFICPCLLDLTQTEARAGLYSCWLQKYKRRNRKIYKNFLLHIRSRPFLPELRNLSL